VRLTPLHYAARANKIDCVKLLLKYGANAVAIDDLGRKPIDIADAGAQEIRESLSNASNQSGSKNL
jgi:ankyrin repeat protein